MPWCQSFWMSFTDKQSALLICRFNSPFISVKFPSIIPLCAFYVLFIDIFSLGMPIIHNTGSFLIGVQIFSLISLTILSLSACLYLCLSLHSLRIQKGFSYWWKWLLTRFTVSSFSHLFIKFVVMLFWFSICLIGPPVSIFYFTLKI